MKQLLLILSFTLGLTTAANALYINNRTDWADMQPNQVDAFVMGITQAIVQQKSSDTNRAREWKGKISQCLWDMKISSNGLVDLLNTYYLDISKWDQSPVQAMMWALDELCVKD